MTIPKPVLDDIINATGATDVVVEQTLQELWSGYGSIVKLQLVGATSTSAILKFIEPPGQAKHPRGWNTSNSHQRKIRSYQVETNWYEHYANQCGDSCKVPHVLAVGSSASRQWILMEDLTPAYPLRAANLTVSQAQVCLSWLAAFHAQFLMCKPDGLWTVGTYWHLETRSDELASMPESQLKTNAAELDKRLSDCEYQCLVHGDAKVANFCFSTDMASVAAVDFQYVGGGVGIKDVVYFLGSCIDENTIDQHEAALLSGYFKALHRAIALKHGAPLADQVEQAWSNLYAIAWTDFYRFLEGWMPGHQKINRYTKQLSIQAFDQLSKS